MTKIMLVEDDKSLREIYGVRLLAEGYDIVSAGDGEEALAVAIKERPALIVTDIMMPKISGFDMLDILRSTTETKNIKVIVMTALGSDEQRMRGEQLGADRYLVKSQVGIEDVVRTVHEVLGDKPAAPATAAVAPQPPSPGSGTPAAPRPVAPATTRPAAPALTTTPPQPGPNPSTQRQMAAQPTQLPAPAATNRPVSPQPPITPQTPAPPSIKNRVIQPLNDPAASKININELLDKELAREAGIDVDNRPEVASTAQEKAVVQDQLKQFSPQPTPPASQPAPTPTIQIDTNGQVSMPPTPQPTELPASGTPPTPPPPVR